jgi:hypothetical protein
MDQNLLEHASESYTDKQLLSQVGFGVQVNLDSADEVGEEEVGRSM